MKLQIPETKNMPMQIRLTPDCHGKIKKLAKSLKSKPATVASALIMQGLKSYPQV